MTLLRSLIAALLLLTAQALVAAPPEPFAIAGQRIAPGTRADVRIIVPAGRDGETFIPLTVIHGTEPGPVLAMVAGVHGFEFASILAAERLAERVDPARIKGTLVIVRVANIPAFEGRSPNVNPVDRKNLNRVFPGDPGGTQTQRIADRIAREVVAHSSFLMDVHSGDGAEFLEAFVGAYGGPLATDFPLALRVAQGFGFPNIVRYSMETQAQIDRGRSLNRQGVAMGKPTILVEIGQNGSREEAHVAAIVAGVENALSILGMIDARLRDPASPARLFDGTTAVSASHAGLYHPVDPRPRPVARGELLGIIRDYTGREVERLVSPVDGYALYGITGPPVAAGDDVVTIAVPTTGF
ncbi:M14 family metallopeptidase [Erythrobacter oryzae]|uniref:M14 family metallopeptidase n=1 Tax=Erythrobacter oryzae TaxID=3019556 RepID=UPI002554386F|nr:M14 family metallopeptidase [Erythrobacter sp. COR-2]